MERFFCGQCEVSDKIIIKDKPEIHHIKDVFRLKVNDRVELIDGKGTLYKAVITEIKKDKIILIIEDKEIYTKEKLVKVVLACAIPKKAKMDSVVEKLTELGVDTIIPLVTQRTIVNVKGSKQESIVQRWQKIAIEASKQAKRIFIPNIEKIMEFKEAIDFVDCDIKLIPTLAGKREGIIKIIQNKKINSIFVMIGPEGDFSESEIRLAKQEGFIPVSLGDFVLKVDTAALSVAAVISNLFNVNNDD